MFANCTEFLLYKIKPSGEKRLFHISIEIAKQNIE